MPETIIISLGGSLIVPEKIDSEFLRNFRDLILVQIKKGKKFVIITGGGRVCRIYQETAKELATPTHRDLDWIGIASLKLNAELLRVIFGEIAHSEVISDLSKPFFSDKSVVIGSALEPGWSSDMDAVWAAKTIGARTVINLSNTDYVYDKDPRTNPDAKKFEKISWKDYRKMIPKEWHPGLSTPFDPMASQVAEEALIKVVVMNGRPVENLENFLEKREFKGTEIF